MPKLSDNEISVGISWYSLIRKLKLNINTKLNATVWQQKLNIEDIGG